MKHHLSYLVASVTLCILGACSSVSSPKQPLDGEKEKSSAEAPSLTASPIKTFVTVWKTESDIHNLGNPSISLPLVEHGNYNFQVDWGDGTRDMITRYNQPETTHRYPKRGKYIVTIEGLIEGWSFDDQDTAAHPSDNAKKLLEITHWGSLRFAASEGAEEKKSTVDFNNAQNLAISATDIPNLKGAHS